MIFPSLPDLPHLSAYPTSCSLTFSPSNEDKTKQGSGPVPRSIDIAQSELNGNLCGLFV